MRRIRVAPIAAAVGFCLVGAAAAHAEAITGAGSSFAAPIYGKWAEAAASSTGITLNYQSIGSGAGQTQIINRTVDFGASDAPVSADRLSTNHLVQFPTVMGAVDLIVNVPGISVDQLKLDGPTIAAIYLGDVVKWNDPKIAALNPGVTLPSIAIAPVYRADGSGTTYVFTDYLAKVSPGFKTRVGSATSVKWPAGSGAKGSEGVSGTVKNIRGGIGYVESAYASRNRLVTVQLRAHDGGFLKASLDSFAAAAAAADWTHATNFAVDLNDEPGATSWPIVSATFVLLPANPTDATKSAAVLKFFDWAYTSGDPVAHDLQYVPLPASVKSAVREVWRAQVHGPGGAAVYK